MRRSLGICLGASNIKAVELLLDGDARRIGRTRVRGHESNPRRVLLEMLQELDAWSFDHVGVTGRKFRERVAMPSITEPEAVEHALRHLRVAETGRPPAAVASLGAENFVVYLLDAAGNVASVDTGNKCASGTGEFFLQQIGRMAIGVEDAIRLAAASEMYKVSGRCSVFCKSDCTHALNKGIPIGRVTAGLSRMMAEKVLELVEKLERKDVMAIGGVTANTVVMEHLRSGLSNLRIPEYADVFEALGAAVHAADAGLPAPRRGSEPFAGGKASFTFLPPIREGAPLVEFREMEHGTARAGDRCVVGLDVGSTTTKAVVLRIEDNAVLASVYLRTNGNPVRASRECYGALQQSLAAPVHVVGLATTGSGRQIAGLHAGTEGIVNEIIAHATAAAHFDPQVDTIFEIGGQDAKYTFLCNAVPSDYAMNEACSAGTGSFLEESARESLGLSYREIEGIALEGERPPNFNDQCAAFISSDIKTATHEGIDRPDIVAGLVYSICTNYTNRVKGQRRVGSRIFMQGGVCYNKAVPLAMANLVGRPIIVPPDPGLMGAFGVALEWKNRLQHGLAQASAFDLGELAGREIEYGTSFICRGGRERCDRGCEINRMTVAGRTFPFGGACNKYYNLVHHLSYEAGDFDLVQRRQARLFDPKPVGGELPGRPVVGISRAYLANTLYPLYRTFFEALGCRVEFSGPPDPEGMKRRRSTFCYPGEIAHGCFADLLRRKPDCIFLPVVTELHVANSVSTRKEHQCTCMLLQSEVYCLKSAFRPLLDGVQILAPVISFRLGYEAEEGTFAGIAADLGFDRRDGVRAYRAAVAAQQSFERELREEGRRALAELEQDPARVAVVLMGRSYNAFAADANMGIPTKFASRGVTVIPWDALDLAQEPCDPDMCWANGQLLLRAASFVKRHPQLFAAFITNFSCGPDSFLLGYVREIFRTKPSLTLELDSHTADAGINTRIEAFLDIVARYRELGRADEAEAPLAPAAVERVRGRPVFRTSAGAVVPLTDPRVHVLIPAMGRLASDVLAAAFRGSGIRATALTGYDFDVLKLGRANSSCKECLPLQLTLGGLLNYMDRRADSSEYLAYFMPTATGNCRFTQYSVFTRALLRRQRWENVALLTLTAENGYAGLPQRVLRTVLQGANIADVMDDIRAALYVLAVDRDDALAEFERQWARIVAAYETGQGGQIYRLLGSVAEVLRRIPLRAPLREAKVVSLMGEIFVRRDDFSCQDLVERLARRGIVVKRAPVFEWLAYIDEMVRRGVYEAQFDLKGWLEFRAKTWLQNGYERRVKQILGRSGLYQPERVDIRSLLAYGGQFFDVEFTGECVLVVGSFFKEILHSVQGVVSIGPFACMPTRVIEAVLSGEATAGVKQDLDARVGAHHRAADGLPAGMSLPFLSIESDGNPFPQVLEARIDAFCLQVERIHRSESLRD